MANSNLLGITFRDEFRKWLAVHHSSESECWVAVKRGKTPPTGALWHLDAVEEALCFGWIDSTLKNAGGISLQRFSPRTKSSRWTELNKERCRRLEKLGLMTDSGRKVCPDLTAEFEIMPEIVDTFKAVPAAWDKFTSMPQLYQRVRIDNIQRVLANPDLFRSRLGKLVEATARGEMIGDWHDYGRLLDY